MNAIYLFFLTASCFLLILIPVDRYSYPLRSLRSLVMSGVFLGIISLLINPSVFDVIAYLFGAVGGTVVATFLNRRSAIMGG